MRIGAEIEIKRTLRGAILSFPKQGYSDYYGALVCGCLRGSERRVTRPQLRALIASIREHDAWRASLGGGEMHNFARERAEATEDYAVKAAMSAGTCWRKGYYIS
jgi:hypothetical protein